MAPSAARHATGPGRYTFVRQGNGAVPFRGNISTSIVNPAELPPRLADNVCMNCHQGGHTRILQPGKDYTDFRPGTPLDLVSAIFKLPLDPDQREEADKAQTQAPVRGSLEMPSWWKNSRCRCASAIRRAMADFDA